MVSASDTVNLFNTPVISEEQYEDADDVHGLLRQASIGDWKITRFERSPLMSTYLVAFANGQFEYLESSFKSPISGKTRPIRVYGMWHYVAHYNRHLLNVNSESFFDPSSKIYT